MDGSAELRQLAYLLRVGADTARDIAEIRQKEKARLCELARQAEQIAVDLDRLVGVHTVCEGGRA